MKLAEDFYQKARPASADLADLKRRSSGEGINIRWSPSFQKEELALGFELDILRRAAGTVSEPKVANALDQRVRELERELGSLGRATAPSGKTGARRKPDLRRALSTAKRRVKQLSAAGKIAALEAVGCKAASVAKARLTLEDIALCLIGADRFGWTSAKMLNEDERAKLRERIMGRESGRRAPHTPTK